MKPQRCQFRELMAGAAAPRPTAREKSEAEIVESEFERATMRKVMRRFVPVLFVSSLVALLDRTNVGFAALTMNNDLGLSSTAFGFGAGLFFLTYILFEVPSNLALERFGARRWIARIMFTWGLLAGATAFVQGEFSFYAVRLLLGAAEAGFFPGVFFFFTLWMPFGYRARVLAIFLAAGVAASVIGSPVSGLLMQLNGLAGLKGWQWMFLIEALPALLLTPVILRVLSDKPSDASWLRVPERDWLIERLDKEACQRPAADQHGLLNSLLSPVVIWLGAAYFGTTGISWGLVFFLPQIVEQFGLSIVQTGFVSAIPFAVAMVGMIWWGRRSDRLTERRFHLLLPLALAAIGLAASTLVGSPLLRLALLSIAAFGVYSAIIIFWTLAPRFLAPRAAAAGIALINSLGNLSGFVDTYTIGAIRDLTGSFSGGLQLLSGFGVIALLILAVLTHRPSDRTVALESGPTSSVQC
jgi:MFS transporter, ACS family, tartrate transporter